MGRLKKHYHEELEKMAHEEHRLSDESIKTIRKVLLDRLVKRLATYTKEEVEKMKDDNFKEFDFKKAKELLDYIDSIEAAIDDIDML